MFRDKIQIFCVLHARLCAGLDWIKIRLNFKQGPIHVGLCFILKLSSPFPTSAPLGYSPENTSPLTAPRQLSSATAEHSDNPIPGLRAVLDCAKPIPWLWDKGKSNTCWAQDYPANPYELPSHGQRSCARTGRTLLC